VVTDDGSWKVDGGTGEVETWRVKWSVKSCSSAKDMNPNDDGSEAEVM